MRYIASAFDKVWHIGLLHKMLKLKFPSYIIFWLFEFLKDRKFRVKCEDYISDLFDITAGVPQGAVLSPILFSIYINDNPLWNKKNRDYGLLFADDLISLNIFKKFGNIEKHVNKYLRKLEGWLKKWRLMMAPSKCNYLVFSKKSESEAAKLNLKLFNENVCVSESPTFLGIRFDRHLTFKNQINYLQDTCINRLNFLKIISKRSFGLKTETLNYVYISIIRSVLEYSSLISCNLAKSNLKKILTIQSKAIKIINHKPIYASLREIETDIISLEDRFEQLNKKYIINAILNGNELITTLWNEYLEYKTNHPLFNDTILCNFKDEITNITINN